MTGSDHLYGVAVAASVAECARCGLWFQSPRLPADRHGELYPAGYGPHAALPASAPRIRRPMLEHLRRTMGYRHLPASRGPSPSGLLARLAAPLLRHRAGVALIPHYVEGGRVLDAGCGHGQILRSLRALGWTDLHGIEPDAGAAEIARASGATVVTARVEKALRSYPDGHFDVIVASMLLEHVDQPYEVMRELARKLRPGGQLVMSTVSRDSVDARLFGEYWAGFDFPRHMTYFRRSDIAALLARDLEHLEWFDQIAPIDWQRSASWRRSRIDRLILSAGPLVRLASALFALTGRATRVSLRGRRRRADTPRSAP